MQSFFDGRNKDVRTSGELNTSIAPEFDVKSVVVTGGTRGIGLETVRLLAAEGNAVTTLGRNQDRIEQLGKKLPGVEFHKIDLLSFSDPGNLIPTSENLADFFKHPEIQELVERVKQRAGSIDAVVLNAGITGLDPEVPIDVGAWTFSTLAQIVAVAPELARSQGILISVTSPLVHQEANFRRDLGKVPEEVQAYISMKAAMEGWLIKLSAWTERELGWSRICFFDPGSVDTGMHQEVVKFAGPELRERTGLLIESGRLRDPQVIGKILAKVAVSGKFYNPDSGDFSADIASCDRLAISDELYDTLAATL